MSVGNVLNRGVFVVAAKRTPFGTFGGSLKNHSPVDLQVGEMETKVSWTQYKTKINLYFPLLKMCRSWQRTLH